MFVSWNPTIPNWFEWKLRPFKAEIYPEAAKLNALTPSEVSTQKHFLISGLPESWIELYSMYVCMYVRMYVCMEPF